MRVATGLPSPTHNSIGRARLELDEVAPAVEKVRAWYGKRGVGFFWWTGEQSSPPDLDDRLLAAGLQAFDQDMPGMAMALEDVDESAR